MARPRRNGSRITVPIAAVYGEGAAAEEAFARAVAAGANPATLAHVILGARRFRRAARAGAPDRAAWRRWTRMWGDEIARWRFTDNDGNEARL